MLIYCYQISGKENVEPSKLILMISLPGSLPELSSSPAPSALPGSVPYPLLKEGQIELFLSVQSSERNIFPEIFGAKSFLKIFAIFFKN